MRLWVTGIRRKDAQHVLVQHLRLFLQICADTDRGKQSGRGETGYRGRQRRLYMWVPRVGTCRALQ
eukprot:2036385-Prymnesium_polylepis.1